MYCAFDKDRDAQQPRAHHFPVEQIAYNPVGCAAEAQPPHREVTDHRGPGAHDCGGPCALDCTAEAQPPHRDANQLHEGWITEAFLRVVNDAMRGTAGADRHNVQVQEGTQGAESEVQVQVQERIVNVPQDYTNEVFVVPQVRNLLSRRAPRLAARGCAMQP